MARSMLDINEQEGIVRVIRRALERKFGQAPPEVMARVEAIHDTDRLVEMAARAGGIGSIEELFAEDAPPAGT